AGCATDDAERFPGGGAPGRARLSVPRPVFISRRTPGIRARRDALRIDDALRTLADARRRLRVRRSGERVRGRQPTAPERVRGSPLAAAEEWMCDDQSTLHLACGCHSSARVVSRRCGARVVVPPLAAPSAGSKADAAAPATRV